VNTVNNTTKIVPHSRCSIACVASFASDARAEELLFPSHVFKYPHENRLLLEARGLLSTPHRCKCGWMMCMAAHGGAVSPVPSWISGVRAGARRASSQTANSWNARTGETVGGRRGTGRTTAVRIDGHHRAGTDAARVAHTSNGGLSGW